MSETESAAPKPIAEITAYHAHIYYDPATTRGEAERLRNWIAERFSVQLGRWRDMPVGPHPRAMYQVAFAPALFPLLVPFLMLNRLGLTVLVHPETDDPQTDHLVHALWLGEVLPLDASNLPRSLRARGESPSPIVPNTNPSLNA
jgi:aromatic ring-cleaving dioxygenase